MPLFLPIGPGTPSSSLAKDATLSRSRSRVRIPPGSPNPPAGSGVVRKSRRLRKLQSKHQLACTTSCNTGGGTWHHRSCSPCSRFEASRGRIKRSSYRPAWCLRAGLEDLGDHRTDVLFSRIARTARASASCRARTTRKSCSPWRLARSPRARPRRARAARGVASAASSLTEWHLDVATCGNSSTFSARCASRH